MKANRRLFTPSLMQEAHSIPSETLARRAFAVSPGEHQPSQAEPVSQHNLGLLHSKKYEEGNKFHGAVGSLAVR